MGQAERCPTTSFPLRPDGASLELHALDRKHAKHGEKIELKWRA